MTFKKQTDFKNKYPRERNINVLKNKTMSVRHFTESKNGLGWKGPQRSFSSIFPALSENLFEKPEQKKFKPLFQEMFFLQKRTDLLTSKYLDSYSL